MSKTEIFRCPLIRDQNEWGETRAGASSPIVRCTSMAVDKPPQAKGEKAGNRICECWYYDESEKQLKCYESTQLSKFRVRPFQG